jgi:hypothetical protein
VNDDPDVMGALADRIARVAERLEPAPT